jgi:hypothetical protein
MEGMLGNATLGAGKDAVSLWCWFVEDDAAGHSGYATMDGRAGYAPPDGGGLFPTIESVRDAISHQDNKTPWIVPHYGGEIPRGWKIRGLTTNEVERLGLVHNTMWNQH